EERRGPTVDARYPEQARVAEADGDDRRVRWLLGVLVEAETRAWGIEVGDHRVGLEVLGGRRAERVGHRLTCEARDVRRQRLDRRPVGVVCGAAVCVRVP